MAEQGFDLSFQHQLSTQSVKRTCQLLKWKTQMSLTQVTDHGHCMVLACSLYSYERKYAGSLSGGQFNNSLYRFARWRRARSISTLAPDDWLMMTVVPAFYTTLIVCLNVTASGGGSNLYPPEQFSTFTEEDIKERIKGSKIVVVSEQVMN